MFFWGQKSSMRAELFDLFAFLSILPCVWLAQSRCSLSICGTEVLMLSQAH